MSLSKVSKKQLTNRYSYRSYVPCGKCARHCDKEENIIKCGICDKTYHRSCIKLSKKKYKEIIESKEFFVCSNRCYNKPIALSSCDDIDFYSAIYGEGLYPCVRCKRDCLKYSACNYKL